MLALLVLLQLTSFDCRYSKAKTIFDAAVEKGLSVMGVDWPVTVGAPMDPLFPGNDDDPGIFLCIFEPPLHTHWLCTRRYAR